MCLNCGECLMFTAGAGLRLVDPAAELTADELNDLDLARTMIRRRRGGPRRPLLRLRQNAGAS